MLSVEKRDFRHYIWLKRASQERKYRNQPKNWFHIGCYIVSSVGKVLINQISNFTLEMIILGACATIQLDVISQYFVPLFIHALVLCGVTFIFTFAWNKKIHHEQWFEKALMEYGMCTGSNPQGFALVRAVDPNGQSCILEALGVYNAVFFWNFLILPFAATLVLYNRVPIYIIGIALMCTCPLGLFLFKREKK